jgi:spermidine/putrescine transport system substrate-binding protein
MPQDQRGPARRPLTRRAFLGRSGQAALVLGGAVLLDACGGGNPAAKAPAGPLLASPENPVTWPIAADNQPIADGLEPEKNAVLKLYNWAEYINKDTVKAFEKQYKKYGAKVEISTFNTMNEAIAKLRSGKVSFDVFFPTYDVLGKLIQANFLRPLNHTYVANITNVWPEFQNPFYDQQWQYSVPYTVYNAGIAWRTDKVSEDVGKRANPWEALWDPKYKGKVGLLDDYREAMSMVLLKNGITNLNTGNQADIDKVRDDLLAMAKAVNPTVNTKDYVDLPESKTWITHAWSGDMVNAQYYMPKGQSADVMRYWAPPSDKAPVNNDLMVLMRSGKAPVLAHHFLNFMLDHDHALENMSWNGYQPPQNKITTKSLVADEYVPANLTTAVVTPEYVAKGLRELELSPQVDNMWLTAWEEFKAGA